MNWLSAITAVSKLFGALTGLYRDWRLRRTGAKGARLAALEAGQARAKRLAEITAHLDTLVTMNWIAACDSINAPADGCGWVKPIIVAEEDRLTTATKQALLAHNEA